MLVFLSLGVGHVCINNDVSNVAERECFFGSYNRFEYLAGIAADMLACPNNCNSDCGDFTPLFFECSTLGVLVNYREACGSYYAEKVMPKVYEACGLLGTTKVEVTVPICTELDNYIFNPRMPACHGSSAPSPETASFAVFYVLISVGMYISTNTKAKEEIKQEVKKRLTVQTQPKPSKTGRLFV